MNKSGVICSHKTESQCLRHSKRSFAIHLFTWHVDEQHRQNVVKSRRTTFDFFRLCAPAALQNSSFNLQSFQEAQYR